MPWDQHNVKKENCTNIQQYRLIVCCRYPMDIVHSCNSLQIPQFNLYLFISPFDREYEKLFDEIVFEDLVGIYKKTGCLKPCHYMKYQILGDKHSTSYQSSDLLFSLNSISNDTFVEREQLIYPWTELVADFGGSISLFLGVSFMSLWDGIHFLRAGLRLIQNWVDQRK